MPFLPNYLRVSVPLWLDLLQNQTGHRSLEGPMAGFWKPV